jgi:hypothetical protein
MRFSLFLLPRDGKREFINNLRRSQFLTWLPPNPIIDGEKGAGIGFQFIDGYERKSTSFHKDCQFGIKARKY